MTRIKKLPFKVFKEVYSKVPRLCVEILVKTKNGVLLTMREIPPDIGKWHLPGGTVLMGEALRQTAKRVAKEELGVKIKTGPLIGINHFVTRPGISETFTVVFLVTSYEGTLKGSSQARIIDFFKKIPKNTIEEHKNFLVEYLKNPESVVVL